MRHWIESFPWWSLAAASFALGALVGVAIRLGRRDKYESRDA